MGEPKENRSFFRKVVQFVSNPTMEWGELTSRPDDGKSTERSELRAMVERKRRNDFVRKREFDTLRRVRREGLTPEQLMALGPSSRLDDGESRFPSEAAVARTQGVVKAKIDHIEREMVGDGPGFRGSKTAAFFDAPTEPGVLARRGPGSLMAPLSGVPRVSDVLEEGAGVGAAASKSDWHDLPPRRIHQSCVISVIGVTCPSCLICPICIERAAIAGRSCFARAFASKSAPAKPPQIAACLTAPRPRFGVSARPA